MLRWHRNKNRLFCFSPPVMIATCVIELGLLLYTLWRYKLSTIGRLAVALLALLATFQLAEFQVCTPALGEMPIGWVQLGYIAITLLPAVGIHLVLAIAGKKQPVLLWAAYGSSTAFALLFGLRDEIFRGYVCAGNYNIFQLASPFGGVYFAFYYFWLAVGIGLAWSLAVRASKTIQKALYLQIVGYLCFMVPTAIINTLAPQTLKGLPSIMCGFAVLYAIILTIGIVPLLLKPRAK